MEKLGNKYQLQIFPETRTCEIVLDLKEEETPIIISANYEIQDNVYSLSNISCSKKWIQEGINFYETRHKIKLKLSLETFIQNFVEKFI